MSIPLEIHAESETDQGVGQIYLLFAACLCLIVSVGFTADLWSRNVGLATSEILLIFVPAVLFVRRKGLPLAEALRWRPVSLFAPRLVSVVLGVSANGIGREIRLFSNPFIGSPPRIPYFGGTTVGALVIGLFCGAILPGICEETLFRGAIQGTLDRKGPHKAVLITSLLFGLFHLDPWHFLTPLFLGVVAGILTFRTGSTIPAMIAHASFNATAEILNCLTNYLGNHQHYLVMTTLAATFILVFAIYLAKTRHDASPPGLLAFVPADVSQRTLVVAAAGSILLIELAFFVFQNWLAWQYISSQQPVPGLHAGDRVLLLRGPLAQIGLAPGEVVSFESDGEFRLLRIERTDRTRVWPVDWPTKSV